MSSKKKVFAVAITTVALTAGSFGVAGAASKSAKVTKSSYSSVATQGSIAKPGRGADLAALLATLVTKGTITQAQADAIVAAADAARPADMGPKDGIRVSLEERLAVVSKVLGIDTATITSRVKAGETLATIAGAKKAELITALVADETKRIDAAVTAGTLTAAQATTLKANLTAHVTAEVENTMPPKGPGMGPKGGKGGRGHGGHGHGEDGMGASGAPTIPTPAPTPTN